MSTEYQEKILEYISNDSVLSQALRYFIKTNNGLTNPYHNLNHTLSLAALVLEYFNGNYGQIDESLKDDLILAVIFHDYDHTGGKEKDDVNIRIAKDGLKYFVTVYNLENTVNLEFCNSIIDATQFPYTNTNDTLTLPQCLVRECDLLSVLKDDYFTQSFMGLVNESPNGVHQDLSVFVKNCRNFIVNETDKMILPFSKEVISKELPKILNVLTAIEEVL